MTIRRYIVISENDFIIFRILNTYNDRIYFRYISNFKRWKTAARELIVDCSPERKTLLMPILGMSLALDDDVQWNDTYFCGRG
jgi:hypothetical protein